MGRATLWLPDPLRAILFRSHPHKREMSLGAIMRLKNNLVSQPLA